MQLFRLREWPIPVLVVSDGNLNGHPLAGYSTFEQRRLKSLAQLWV